MGKNNELKKKTQEFKTKLNNKETLDSILVEAFSVVREAAKRTLKQRHFNVQLMGGMVLHKGMIAEMKTGEGKTLAATLPVYLNALEGKGVHVVTVNDYLAKRDSEWMGKIYKFLEDATKDLHYLYATTNRKRSLNLKVVNLKKGINEIVQIKNKKIGIVFGPERSGINNDDISLCDKIINIPLNIKFNSLNLSQSVLLIVYELFNNLKNRKDTKISDQKALKSKLFNFFHILENSLENNSFFRVKEKKKLMVRNIRTIFEKANLTEQEIKIILGIIKVLKNKKFS